jgi:hypothetical protein
MERDREEAFAVLDSWAANPGVGLPEELFLFVSRLIPMINVDLLISDDQGRIHLTWRDDEIFGAGWHVPGAMIRYKETLKNGYVPQPWKNWGPSWNSTGAPLSSRSLILGGEFGATWFR